MFYILKFKILNYMYYYGFYIFCLIVMNKLIIWDSYGYIF